MLYDAYQEKQITDRCWLIYDLVTEAFDVPQQFHIEFLSQVELALTSGYLQNLVEITRAGHFLHLHEEYGFRNYELVIMGYSYDLLDRSKQNILRADPLPHHRVDYRHHRLTYFPHHLHDEKGRVHSFTGQVEDFISRSAVLLDTVGAL